MFKKCKVVMLPTNQKAPIEKQIGSSRIDLFIGFANDKNDYIPNHERSFKQFQHLYILSDDEIKENDWCINRNLDTIYQIKAIVGNLENWIKIIATTDLSLGYNDILSIRQRKGLTNHYPTFKPLPSIPQSFIKKYVSEYNKGNQITDIFVEYEEI